MVPLLAGSLEGRITQEVLIPRRGIDRFEWPARRKGGSPFNARTAEQAPLGVGMRDGDVLGAETDVLSSDERNASRSLRLSSASFEPNQRLPRQFTKAGENISSALSWQEEPAHTASFAVLLEDPDAPRGVFTPWACFNVPAQTHGLPPGMPKRGAVGEGTIQGKNEFGGLGYDGAHPPPGPPHHYHVALYALDIRLPLHAGASKQEVLRAMQGHVLEQAELVGLSPSQDR